MWKLTVSLLFMSDLITNLHFELVISVPKPPPLKCPELFMPGKWPAKCLAHSNDDLQSFPSPFHDYYLLSCILLLSHILASFFFLLILYFLSLLFFPSRLFKFSSISYLPWGNMSVLYFRSILFIQKRFSEKQSININTTYNRIQQRNSTHEDINSSEL